MRDGSDRLRTLRIGSELEDPHYPVLIADIDLVVDDQRRVHKACRCVVAPVSLTRFSVQAMHLTAQINGDDKPLGDRNRGTRPLHAIGIMR